MSERSTAIRRVDGDPSGSIFLPKTDRPLEELERIRQQILFERGKFRGQNLTPVEINALLTELDRVRDWHIGRVAVLA